MDKLECVYNMLVDRLYTEFTEHDIEMLSLDKVGKVADIIKDLSKAIKYSEHVEIEETPSDVTSIINRASALLKESEMTAMEKGALKSKLQMMIQSL